MQGWQSGQGGWFIWGHSPLATHQNTTHYLFQGVRDPFLESPGSFSGPKSNIQIEI